MPRGRPRHADILTPREFEVLDLLREGLTNEQVAKRLGISESGARFHVSEILSKLGVSSREEAVQWAELAGSRRHRVPVLLSLLGTKVAVASLGVAAFALTLLTAGVVVQALRDDSQGEMAVNCQVTEPNGSTPPGELSSSPGHHGNGAIWVGTWPKGEVIFEPDGAGDIHEDGSMEMKFWWWRKVPGQLEIEGQRLDAPAPPLRAVVPEGYGNIGFQAASLIFSSPGCWQVTGHVGQQSLTFVTFVSLRR